MSPVEPLFEGLTVFAPRDWDRFCTDPYDDYMELSSEDKRKMHVPLMLDVGDATA